jgi:hypothetical protein
LPLQREGGTPWFGIMTSPAAKISDPPPSLRQTADAVFDRVSPYDGDGFRNHCRRLHRFATMLMRARGLELDDDHAPPGLVDDVAYMIAMWHDLGLVSEQDEGENYLRRSHALFQRESAGLDLRGADPKVIEECMVYNHRLFPVKGVAAQAECFRRAVIVEHSHGLKSWGLPRDAVREVFADHPRGNFDRVLVDFTWRTIKREPKTLVRGIFF